MNFTKDIRYNVNLGRISEIFDTLQEAIKYVKNNLDTYYHKWSITVIDYKTDEQIAYYNAITLLDTWLKFLSPLP